MKFCAICRKKPVRPSRNGLGKYCEDDNCLIKSRRAGARLRRTGVSQEQYEEAFAAQQGRCAICGTAKPSTDKRSFAADHDHVTGKFRGLLCTKCNQGLGLFKDNPLLLETAILYLKRFK